MSISQESQVSLPDPPVVGTLWDLFAQGLAQSPKSPALICMHQPLNHLAELSHLPSEDTPKTNSDCLTWSYESLHEAIRQVAGGLMHHNVKPNTPLVTVISSGVEWTIAYWVAAFLRLTFVPLDPGILTPARTPELEFYTQRLKASVVFVTDTAQAKVWKETSTRLGIDISSRLIIRISEGEGEAFNTFKDLARDCHPDSIPRTPPFNTPDDPTRTAQILFTSGTSTGKPKGCPLTIENITNGQATYIRSRQIHPSTRNILHSANFRAGANSYTGCIAAAGACNIIPDLRLGTVPAILDAIEQQGGNYLWCMPAQLLSMTSDPSFPSRDLRPLEIMFVSGDIVTRSTVSRAETAFPTAKVLSGHGMTEGVGNIGWWDIPSATPTFGEILALGKCLPGAHIKICEDGKVVPRGRTGELHIRSKKTISGYLDNAQAEMFYTDAEGKWVITGDRAMMDEEGYVYIVGRSKDIIMRSGIPIPPSVIESCLNTGGVQAQVLGFSSPTLGETPVAILSSLEGKTTEKWKAMVVDMLGKDYAVGEIFTWEDIGMKEWPLNASGKIEKHRVRETVVRYLEDNNKVIA